jgi:hypothetical protein
MVSTSISTSASLSTTSTSSTSTSVASAAGLNESRLDIKQVFCLALPIAGLVPSLTGEIFGLFTVLVKELSVGPFLVLTSSLVGTADFGRRPEIGLASGTLGEVLVVGLGLLLLLLLLLWGSSGIAFGNLSNSIRICRVDTSSILLGKFGTGKFIVPFALTLGATPTVCNLLLMFTAGQIMVSRRAKPGDVIGGGLLFASCAVTVGATTASTTATASTSTGSRAIVVYSSLAAVTVAAGLTVMESCNPNQTSCMT